MLIRSACSPRELEVPLHAGAVAARQVQAWNAPDCFADLSGSIWPASSRSSGCMRAPVNFDPEFPLLSDQHALRLRGRPGLAKRSLHTTVWCNTNAGLNRSGSRKPLFSIMRHPCASVETRMASILESFDAGLVSYSSFNTPEPHPHMFWRYGYRSSGHPGTPPVPEIQRRD